MNEKETTEFLRRQGFTEDQLTGHQAFLDQIRAEVDEMIVLTACAKNADAGEEVNGISGVITAMMLRHGEIPPQTLALFHSKLSRCADAVLTIGSMSDEIQALQARVARLRAGRE